MSVIRVNKTRDYTVMSNYHFKDKRLSLKAKGLLSQMLSLPDDWDYTVAGLCVINKENETAIKSALSELKSCGYLVITKKYPSESESGRIEYEYNIYEQPQEIQGIEKQEVENLPLEIQSVEKQPQLNTKESSTNYKTTKDKILNIYTDDSELLEALRDFEKMRKTIKKPLTERAWKILFSRLDQLSADTKGKIAVLNQSIEHCWQSVYPLKENSQKTKGQERLGWIDDI